MSLSLLSEHLAAANIPTPNVRQTASVEAATQSELESKPKPALLELHLEGQAHGQFFRVDRGDHPKFTINTWMTESTLEGRRVHKGRSSVVIVGYDPKRDLCLLQPEQGSLSRVFLRRSDTEAALGRPLRFQSTNHEVAHALKPLGERVGISIERGIVRPMQERFWALLGLVGVKRPSLEQEFQLYQAFRRAEAEAEEERKLKEAQAGQQQPAAVMVEN